MRSIFLATTLFTLPRGGRTDALRCAAPVHIAPVAPIQIPPPITVGGPPVPLTPVASLAPPPPAPASAASNNIPQTTRVVTVGTSQPPASSDSASTHVMSTADIQATPALAHIASAGASLSDLGISHGLRAVYARNGGQVMVFEVTPDGQAAVAGLITDLSVDQLKAMGGKEVSELHAQHGLRSFLFRNGRSSRFSMPAPTMNASSPGSCGTRRGRI